MSTAPVVPLSFEQEAVLAVERRRGAQRIQIAAFWSDGFDLPALAGALRALLIKHDVFRSRLVTEGAATGQRFEAPDGLRMKVERADLRSVGPEDAPGAAERLISVVRRRPWDLSGRGPLRVVVADFADGRQLLAVAAHYFAVDGVAFQWFVHHLLEAYAQAAAAGASASPASAEGDVGHAYESYVERTRSDARARRAERNVQWWIDLMSAERGPTIEPRPDAVAKPGPGAEVTLAPQPLEAVDAVAHHFKVTTSSVVIAALATGIFACGSASPITIELGATAGRTLCERGTLGNFVMPVRALLHQADESTDLIAQAHSSVTAAMLRSSYSVPGLFAHIDRTRSTAPAAPAGRGRTTTVLLYEARRDGNLPDDQPHALLERLGWERFPAEVGDLRAPNYLEINADADDNALSASLRYASTWFARETIEHLAATASANLAAWVAAAAAG